MNKDRTVKRAATAAPRTAKKRRGIPKEAKKMKKTEKIKKKKVAPIRDAEVKLETGVFIDLLRNLAEQEAPEAQYILGCCYTEGNGVKKDLKEGKEWFRLAAENIDTGWMQESYSVSILYGCGLQSKETGELLPLFCESRREARDLQDRGETVVDVKMITTGR